MKLFWSCLFPLVFLLSFSVEAGYIVRKGRFIERDQYAVMPLDDHFAAAMKAYQEGNMKSAIYHFRIVYSSFPDASQASDAHYYAGLAYWQKNELDSANAEFSEYLKITPHSPRFMEIIERKFAIAEAFRGGAKRRLFQQHFFPKWVKDPALAVQIYDEIIAALPNHERTVIALYHKGLLLKEVFEFRESIESFQTLIRRFPKSEYSPESYLQIMSVYLLQSEYETQNSDIITLADLQLQKFREDFPRDPRIADAEKSLLSIKETYAESLFNTGRFYERKRNPSASILYYKSALHQFPDTMIANLCRQRLQHLCPV